ncbi:unnamed protein product, partial [Staurois parvus]
MGPPTDPGPSGTARVSKWSVRPCSRLTTTIVNSAFELVPTGKPIIRFTCRQGWCARQD